MSLLVLPPLLPRRCRWPQGSRVHRAQAAPPRLLQLCSLEQRAQPEEGAAGGQRPVRLDVLIKLINEAFSPLERLTEGNPKNVDYHLFFRRLVPSRTRLPSAALISREIPLFAGVLSGSAFLALCNRPTLHVTHLTLVPCCYELPYNR